MDLYLRFFFDFMNPFFKGLGTIFKSIFDGIANMFNFPKYIEIIKNYSTEFKGGQWILVGAIVLALLAIVGLIIFLIFLLFKKIFKIRKTMVEQESLLEEVGKLNYTVAKLQQEKERLFAMKVSQLGLKPGEDPVLNQKLEGTSEVATEETNEEEDGKPEVVETNDSRFFKLTELDKELADYQQPETDNTITLEGICEMFRNFAASKMRLYYRIEIIRLYVSSFASTRLIILQGISGTGKTSLAYAWGKFLMNDAVIASVQPSWRDRTELFGYFNEFTKKFNETEVLAKMYEATYKDQVYITILDEMNIARVEYYFAEMLSILEMPSRDEWVITLVPNVWPTDPKKLFDGKLKLPDNMWYIGTINNDDSTFMVTDKVYDRAMPIDLNEKGAPFDAPDTPNLSLSSKYFESLFRKAWDEHQVSQENMDKIEEMDNYVIEHFRMAFGNRIVKQLKEFVPVYIACGGSEIDGIDYVISHKILRKFEQLNLAFIRDEIDGFIEFLNKKFGKENMNECKEYLLRLKKMM